MPGKIIELYVPCRIIEVTVSIAPTEHLSRLETLVLRALYEGVSKFRDLVEMFGLGQRPTLDLVADMWHRGYLALDMEKSELWLTDHVREAIADNNMQRLSSGEVQERKTRVAQELLSGHILRTPRRPTQVQRVRIVPVEYTSRPLGPEHRQGVIGVLDEVLMSTLAVGRGARVLAVNFGLLSLIEQMPTPLNERALMELRVECARHSSSNQLTFQILHPAALPVRVRQSMERELGKLTAQLPAHPFVKAMREHAEMPSIGERLEPSVAAKRLSEQCAKLAEALDPSLTGSQFYDAVRATQEDLELAALPAREVAEELLLSQSRVAVLADEAHYTQGIDEAISTAEKQIILCFPTLKYRALQKLLPRLKDRLSRGVPVFILWGREAESILDTDVNNRLAALQLEYPQLRVSMCSARVGSTLLIMDDQLALLASSDPLLQLHGRALVLGVDLRPGSTQEGGVIAELISFCRNAFPDHRVSNLIEATWAPQNSDPSSAPALLEIPQLLPADDAAWQSGRASVTLCLWREQWRLYAQQIERSVALHSSTATLVTDSQIREVFWSFIGRKQRQLILISERLTSEVVNAKLTQALQERLAEGTRVAVLFSEVNDEGVQKRLQEMADRWPEQMVLHHARPHSLRSECVVSDERVLLSSLQLLSVGGDYVGSRRWRLPMHAGLLLKGTEIVSAILRSLRDAEPELATAFLAESEPETKKTAAAAPLTAPLRPPVAPPPALALVSRLTVAAGDKVRQTEVLREWFSGMSPPLVWASLAQLQRAGLPEIWLAVGCALGMAPGNLKTAQGREWQARLAAHSWHELNSPQQTWLLLQDWPSQATAATLAQLPRLPIVALAAVQDRPEMFTKRQAALPASLASEDVLGAAALSIAAVLRCGSEGAAHWLEGWQDQLVPTISELATAALRYYRRTGRPYPAASVIKELRLLQIQRQREEARKELVGALTEGRQIKTAFTLMRTTWERLYESAGPLGQLERIISAGDSPVTGWYDENAKTTRNLPDWLDEQTRRAAAESGWHGSTRIERGPRMSCLQRLQLIFQAAHRLAELDASILAAPRLRDPNSIEFAHELRRLSDPLRNVVANAAAMRAPSAPLLRNMVDSLRSLIEVVK